MEVHALHHQDIGLKVHNISHENVYNINEVHRHSYYEIFLFDTGFGGKQMIDFENYRVKDKTLYIVVPNQVHLLQKKPDEKGIVLQFTQECLNKHLATASIDTLFALKTNPETPLSDKDYDLLKQSFSQLYKLDISTEVFKKDKLQHYFAFTVFQILGLLKTVASGTRQDSLTLDFLLLAEKNFTAERKTASYAKWLNVSVSKLNAVIKKDLGKTPATLINDLLIIEIKRLVILGQLSHKEISFQLNFDSPSSYNRFVKRHLNCNPSEIIQKIKKHNF